MAKYAVVTTTFNDEKEIQVYLNDMIAQTLLPYEIIIADGGSSDNTVRVIKEYGDRFGDKLIIKVISGKRLNISQGYNTAMREASTDLIGFTGVGNRYASDFFETLIGQMKDDIDIVYCPVRGQTKNSFQKLYRDTFLDGEKGQHSAIPTNHGALVRREAMNKMGEFYEKFIYAGEDAEYYSRANRLGIKTQCVADAKAWWDTPCDFNQFKKQIKNYTIAELQLSTTLEALRASLKPTIIFVMSALLCLFVGLLIVTPIVFLMIFTGYCWISASGFQNGLLLMSKYWLRIFYMAKFHKYLSQEYKVKI